jgi:hypothetical protein
MEQQFPPNHEPRGAFVGTGTPQARRVPDRSDPDDRWFDDWTARKTVQEAASAARLLGVVFAALGAVLLAPVLQRGPSRGFEALGVVNVVILMGPGVWYFLAASWIRRLDRRAVTVSLRVAVVQFVAVAVGLIFGAVTRRDNLGQLAVPAIVALFFMPALAALVYHLVQARSAMNLLDTAGKGFEPIVLRALPVEPAETPPAQGEL